MRARIVFFLISLLATGSIGAQEERQHERAMLNAGRIADQLVSVLPLYVPIVLDRIIKQELPRIDPLQPIWILDITTGTILYYQGKPDFTGQPASRLADETGVRFGQIALNNGLQGNSDWMKIQLGGNAYSAFCKVRDPFVVCSLIL